jgi:hypothetical protein
VLTNLFVGAPIELKQKRSLPKQGKALPQVPLIKGGFKRSLPKRTTYFA